MDIIHYKVKEDHRYLTKAAYVVLGITMKVEKTSLVSGSGRMKVVVQFEAHKDQFPVEVQNEIRAIYGHLVRAAMATDVSQVDRNIKKMKSHSKRAFLDCLKYMGIIYHDEYCEFMSRYDGVDLTYLDDGHFLPKACSLYNESVEMWQKAKEQETSNATDDELYDLYQDAYDHYLQLHELLKQYEESASFLQHKATKRDLQAKKSYRVGIAGFIVGIIGLAVGIAGVVVGIIF